jgi:hypothetical protein
MLNEIERFGSSGLFFRSISGFGPRKGAAEGTHGGTPARGLESLARDRDARGGGGGDLPAVWTGPGAEVRAEGVGAAEAG